ncbi:dTDP-4-dehydrorhamnose 3,5-epimerase [Flavobacteriaceae bacterium MAR_2010_72]|nr:dTDP-4-dehydrorhamnose 3,5-epimerase [Flavobacteriaceae bacterium MAR_2010_72]TVZ58280.1 dTDP-4-dehydrorhamnose 3,5-epimerase [Flavobacteriaceae bacterium MAR_2010_105]
MTIQQTPLKDCVIVMPKVFRDARGSFLESFNLKAFQENTGLTIDFVQDNLSTSSKGVLRGLHFQAGDYAQAKLVSVIKGSVLDVCVDLRKDSKTFGEHFSMRLDDKTKHQLFVPRGFAHGFLTLEDETIFSYKCDNYYNKEAESGIIYNDPDLNINWGIPESELILSEKDRQLPTFETLFK